MIFEKLNFFPTNWENGMKLTSEHFRHLEDSIEDSVRDSRAFTVNAMDAYGLIPNSKFMIQNAQGQSPNSVRVILNSCRAILPGGYRVEVVPEIIQRLKVPEAAPFVEFVPGASSRYHVFMSVDPKNRIPAGKPETRPIRQPFLSQDIQLQCIPNEKMGQAIKMAPDRMKIAEWMDGKLVEAYIPASLSISGFPLLEKWYQFFQNQLENIVRISTHVINEQRKRDPSRAEFCMSLVMFIRSSRSYFKWQLPNRSPKDLIAYFGDLASLTEGLIETCDRDFVRNILKNGQVNDLRPRIQEFVEIPVIMHSETASYIGKVKKFTDSLISTLQMLVTTKPPAPRAGERNISSG